MRYNDQTQGIRGAKLPDRGFLPWRLLSMAVSSSSRMFGFTARRASRRDSSADSFSSASLRAASINARQISRSALTQLKDSVNILLHGVNQFAAGVTVNRAKLAVKGFKLSAPPGCCRFYPAAYVPASVAGAVELQLLRSLADHKSVPPTAYLPATLCFLTVKSCCYRYRQKIRSQTVADRRMPGVTKHASSRASATTIR